MHRALLSVLLIACKAKPSPAPSESPLDASIDASRPRIEELALGNHDVGCARYANGDVWCAGMNSYGELGRGTRNGRIPGDPAAPFEGPARVDGIRDVVRIVAGSVHVCALTKDGSVYCWGGGPRDSDHVGILVPTRIEGIRNATALHSGLLDACAIVDDGAVSCVRSGPMKGLAGVTQLALGHSHGCALTGERKVTCWGELSGSNKSPRRMPMFDGADEIAANEWDVCARTGERVTCLGLHFTKTEEVSALAGVTRLTGAGSTGMCGLTRDATLVCLDALRDVDGGRRLTERARDVRIFATAIGHCAVARDERVRCDSNVLARTEIEGL